MVEPSDSGEETHRQTRVYVSGYITVFHVSAAAFKREAEHFLLHVSDRFPFQEFPQSLRCVYVAETRNSVPETCFFVPSSGGNVKILSGNLTGFSVFPAVSVAVSA